MQLVQVYCSIVRSVLEYACPVWAALPKYLEDAIESVQKRALRIVLLNCHYDDALIQSGVTALSQRREEACTNFIKRNCLSSPVIRPLIPCVSNHPCHTAAILSRETKRALFYHAKPRNGNHGDEA